MEFDVIESNTAAGPIKPWERAYSVGLWGVIVGILGVALASSLAPVLLMEWRGIVAVILAVPFVVFVTATGVLRRDCLAQADEAINQIAILKQQIIPIVPVNHHDMNV